ncbi:lysine N(6)-hydroxylase/L-ornithine N(5)-oxygenase family protein [Natrinema ejinorense]|uniref:Lysine 6-monooxygenase n=1 Tax=Natrinema ejinorense TaxID=373386 RepID=A0A2A5QPM0_9EURY|nr:lysine N(6)-hydroxylase/L-ornithine N(5)-oxygenase family protein [Natrinema ejinorense]PCR88780.1 lysine 6-monooxygenase [Natrinema ejinorense]
MTDGDDHRVSGAAETGPTHAGDSDAGTDPVDCGHVDVLGVGLGPFNLGLAALLAETDVEAAFLEQASTFAWHEGMLIEGATLEVPFLADLVTLADPTSEYSYLNYLRETDRIYEFYFYETFQVPRREYDAYLGWVADRLESCRFSRRVTSVAETDTGFRVEAVDPETGDRYVFTADDLVVGVGSRPYVPDQFRNSLGESIFHTARYRDRRDGVLDSDAIAVVGSGQSAAEVVLDLLERQSDHGYRLDWLTRSDGFFSMEYSKLGLQHFTPEYTRYFYDLDRDTRDEALSGQDLLYKGIDVQTSARIYDTLYERSIGSRDPDFGMLAMTAVEDIEPAGDGYRLACHQTQQDERFVHEADAVVLGTGYHRPTPSFLGPLEAALDRDSKERLRITADYRVKSDCEGRIFVQNAGVYTHGVGTPDLGLGCYRNAVVVEQLASREVYPIDKDTVFQDFDVEQFVTTGQRDGAASPLASTTDRSDLT